MLSPPIHGTSHDHGCISAGFFSSLFFFGVFAPDTVIDCGGGYVFRCPVLLSSLFMACSWALAGQGTTAGCHRTHLIGYVCLFFFFLLLFSLIKMINLFLFLEIVHVTRVGKKNGNATLAVCIHGCVLLLLVSDKTQCSAFFLLSL